MYIHSNIVVIGYNFIFNLIQLGVSKDLIFKLLYESMRYPLLAVAKEVLPMDRYEVVRPFLLEYFEYRENLLDSNEASLNELQSVDLI